MGAHTFSVTSKVEHVEQAYRELVANALHEQGHDPYNGSISTTSGVSVVSRKMVNAAVAKQLMNQRIDDLHKWGNCEAIAVGVPSKTTTRTVWCTVPVEDGKQASVRLTPEVVAAACSIPVSRLGDYTALDSKIRYKTITRQAGPSEKYWTTSLGGRFTCRADAVAYAKETLERRGAVESHGYVVTAVAPVQEVQVKQVTARTPEAAVLRVATSFKVKVRVTIAASDELIFDHWLLYGWAAM